MNSITFQNTISILQMVADIGFIWFVCYYVIKVVRNNARTIQLFKGIMILFIVKGFSSLFGLTATNWLVDLFVNYGVLAVIILFSPEIRNLLEHLGQSNTLTRITTLTGNELSDLVNALVDSSVRLSKEQIGALITIEQGTSLGDYIKTGTKINATVSTELLCSIFVPLTPLHDGAVIIQGNKIACASAYFPPTNLDLPTKYGARHRAAIGISEITDSTTIVISEETGTISIAEKGKLTHVDENSLREYLLKVICAEEVEAKEKKKERAPKNGIKFDFFSNEKPKEETNEDLMNVIKSSKKTDKINPSFSKRRKGQKNKEVNAIENEEVKPVEEVKEPEIVASIDQMMNEAGSVTEELLIPDIIKSMDENVGEVIIDTTMIQPSLKVEPAKLETPNITLEEIDIEESKPKRRTKKKANKGGEENEQ
ncbi:MAG: diadenylate cyclase CdaA [Erysipelotrichales bacterium]|nr:diadenylate cyclase CdaA [Erysipelotrichales bacterium]